MVFNYRNEKKNLIFLQKLNIKRVCVISIKKSENMNDKNELLNE